eukprot:XP_011661232.1 PREDICTED: peroxisomal biogenesis factor 19 [Strongylocentrotus purpuratus]
MATKSEIEDEASATTPVEEKPSKESLSQMVDSESKDDTDLDLLLDSALGDFDKPLQPATLEKPEVASSSPGLNIMTTSKEQEGEKKTEKQTKEGPQLPPNQDALFEALFNESPGAQQSVADFENVLSGLMSELGEGFGGDPQMASEMQRMFQTMAAGAGAGAGAGAMPNPAAGTPASTTSNTSDSNTTQTPEDVTSTLTDTLTRLAQNAKDLQEGGVPDEELLRSFGGMNIEGDNAELLPMVQTMMQSLLSKDILYPSLKEVVDKIAVNYDNLPLTHFSAASNTSDSNTTQTPEDVTSTLTDTLTRLAQNAKDLQEGGVPDEELLRSFGGMNIEGDNAELLPMVQTMMQSLLSKDILYPSLKEVVDKKEPTLSSEDHQRYTEQHRLMSALVCEYEAEQDSETAVHSNQARMGRLGAYSAR